MKCIGLHPVLLKVDDSAFELSGQGIRLAFDGSFLRIEVVRQRCLVVRLKGFFWQSVGPARHGAV